MAGLRNVSVLNVVREWQMKGSPASVRYIARRLGISQALVLEAAEDLELNVNIGICVNGRVGVFDRKGDYTLEDLRYYDESRQGHK